MTDPGQMFVLGSILRAEVANGKSPVTCGYGEEFPVYHQWGPYFRVSEEGVDDGYVLAFGFDATHRFQIHGNAALPWNALLNWNDLGVGLDDEEPTP